MSIEQFGRYEILNELARGGMATVYHARDPRFGREVAVKVLPREFLHDPGFKQRFAREARTIARLEHPAIVPVYDFGDEAGQPYLVMQFMQGGSLANRLNSSALELDEAIRIVERISLALDYAHAHGVIHRDIKPGNILFNKFGDAFLVDFGLARLAESSATLTGSSAIVGTPAYMSPEQVHGDKKLDSRSDIYGLGIVLFEMLTGEQPFQADTPAKLMMQHVLDPVPHVRDINPTLPSDLAAVLAKALAKERDERYSTGKHLVEAIKATTESANTEVPISAANTAETIGEVGSGELRAQDIEAPEIHQEDAQATVIEEDLGKFLRESVGPVTEKMQEIDYSRKLRTQPWLWILAAGVVFVLSLVVWQFNNILGLWGGVPTAAVSPGPDIAATDAVEPVETILAAPTGIPTNASTNTPEVTPEPTLGINSMQVAPTDGMILLFVPEGPFMMGTTDEAELARPDEIGRHEVYLPAYWIDQTEVTNAMFRQFVEATGYVTDAEKNGEGLVWVDGTWQLVEGADWQHPNGPASTVLGLEKHPVVHMSWNDASAYCSWAGRRLLTEAEWEKAARGTDERVFPWGNENAGGDFLNYADRNLILDHLVEHADTGADDGFQYTAPIGSYPQGASPYGVLDMSGNVWEWVADWYAESYYEGSPSENPTGPPEGERKVRRGGAWFNDVRYLRSTSRFPSNPADAVSDIGIRCGLTHE